MHSFRSSAADLAASISGVEVASKGGGDWDGPSTLEDSDRMLVPLTRARCPCSGLGQGVGNVGGFRGIGGGDNVGLHEGKGGDYVIIQR